MPEKVNLGAKAIGRGCPHFITAECGVTCNYDLKLSKELIDVTVEAGADATKFIFWFPSAGDGAEDFEAGPEASGLGLQSAGAPAQG